MDFVLKENGRARAHQEMLVCLTAGKFLIVSKFFERFHPGLAQGWVFAIEQGFNNVMLNQELKASLPELFHSHLLRKYYY